MPDDTGLLKITLVYLLMEFDKEGDVIKETSFRKKVHKLGHTKYNRTYDG